LDLTKIILKIWSNDRLELADSDPLYRQLFEILKLNIQKGLLPSGCYLPSSRLMAETLNISRSTVNRAFELLVFDGLLSAEIGKGYKVEEGQIEISVPLNLKKSDAPRLSDVADSFLKVNIDEEELGNIDSLGLAFRPGVPPVDVFPVRRWMSLTQKYWKDIQFSSLNYKPTSGVQSLKETISNYLRIDRGIQCHPDQVIVVSGSLQSLYLIANTLVNPGDQVFAENPTFQNVVSIFKGMRANLGALEMDEDGAQLPNAPISKDFLKLVHLTPSCHYPLGTEMSEKRKFEWIDFAQKQKCYLIENDYEHEIVHAKKDKPTIFSLDPNHSTIYLSTFNRLLHPSIRVGYMVVPFELLPAVEALMKHSHRFVPPSIQMVLNEFIKHSFLQLHIKNIFQIANERKKAFFRAASEFLPDWKFSETSALHILGNNDSLFSLDSCQGMSDKKVAKLLQEHNIVTHTLSSLYFNGPPKDGLILGHSSVPSSVIQQKIQHWSALF